MAVEVAPTGGWIAAYAAFGLETVDAIADDAQKARRWLIVAADAGFVRPAEACLDSLTDLGPKRRAAVGQLSDLADSDTDALNFLGIAAYRDGDTAQAREHWTESAARNDGVAAMLLHLTS